MAHFGGEAIATGNAAAVRGGRRLEIGVRPEFVSITETGIPADVVKVTDAGRYRIVETRSHDSTVKLLVAEGSPVPEGRIHLAFDPGHTQVYEDGWIAGGRPGGTA